MQDSPALTLGSHQSLALVLPADLRRGFAEQADRRVELGPTVPKPNRAIPVVALDIEHLGCLPATGPEDRHELVPRPGKQAQAGAGEADFQQGRVLGARVKGPKPHALAGFEQRPIRGRVRHHSREHHLERRIAERDLLVHDALHLRAQEISPSPENERGHHDENNPRRDPKPFLPKKRMAPESLKQRVAPESLTQRMAPELPKQGMAPEFFNQWSEPGKVEWIHQEYAVTQPKIARATPLTTSIIPAGKNFLVFRKRTKNITTSARDTTEAVR